jgi:hypothetical protein
LGKAIASEWHEKKQILTWAWQISTLAGLTDPLTGHGSWLGHACDPCAPSCIAPEVRRGLPGAGSGHAES